jgi:protein TonB
MTAEALLEFPARGLGLALAAVLLAACASQPAASPAPHDVAASPARDAMAQVYAEQDVDVPARPLEPLQPRYPERLRQLGVEGRVEAKVVVWPDGSLRGRELIASDHPEFTRAVQTALDEARFVPALRGGQPVASTVTLRLHFRLDP